MCKDFLATLEQYLENVNPKTGVNTGAASDVVSEGKEHLVSCAPCSELVELYLKTGHLTRLAFKHDDDAELPEELVQAILNRRKVSSSD